MESESVTKAPSTLDELYPRLMDGVFTILARHMFLDILDEGAPLLAAMERRHRVDQSRVAIGHAFGTR